MPCVEQLPVVSRERREEILSLPTDAATHEALLESMPFRGLVETQSPSRSPAQPPTALRVVAWNAERGHHPDAASALLEATAPDVVLLSELDIGMARTGQRHTARDLATRLGHGFAYAVEFLELELGGEPERLEHAGASNTIGYHGGAICSRLPLLRPEVVALDEAARWFDGERGERRVGTRIAVLVAVELEGVEVTFAAPHFESHGSPDERALQMERLLEAIERHSAGGPVVIGGDLNTHTLTFADIQDRSRIGPLLADDPNRLREPIQNEPLFALAQRAGFDIEHCNAMDATTQRTSKGRGDLNLDWFLCRGLTPSEAKTGEAVDPTTGEILSDHDPISVVVSLVQR